MQVAQKLPGYLVRRKMHIKFFSIESHGSVTLEVDAMHISEIHLL